MTTSPTSRLLALTLALFAWLASPSSEAASSITRAVYAQPDPTEPTKCESPEPGPGLSWYCVIDKPKFYYIGMGHCREEALEQALLACADSEDVCKAEEAFCEKFPEE